MITVNKCHYLSKMERLHDANEDFKTKIVVDKDEGWGGDGRGVNWGRKYGVIDMGGWRNGGWKQGGWAGGLPRARENNGGENKGSPGGGKNIGSSGGEVEQGQNEGIGEEGGDIESGHSEEHICIR
ncbi:hypothetical protein TSUD_248750 [Trifolium subterraneum]|uniref:Uncharacterized protein n=1 Tax=Trifolium subterraneum TaxID=3900 RepID=A0A2Z6LL23_TRISU|nr:hypothetical protein TSUD_248750 [Trifolium subterraneum]